MIDNSRRLLILLAALLMCAGLLYRLFFRLELNGSLCYEVEAATRLLAGKKAYLDFYFDQPLALAYWRVLTVELANTMAPGFAGRALASYMVTSALGLLSFLLSTFVVVFMPVIQPSSRLSQSAYRQFRELHMPAALVGFSLANLSMAFVYGSCQHIFILLLMPYFFVRVLAYSGSKTHFNLRLLAGLMAGLGFALDPLFLPLALLMELVELIAVKSDALQKNARVKPGISVEVVALVVALAAASAPMFYLSAAAKAELTEWIIPLKLVSYYLEQMAVFGLGASPDRRDIIYYATFALIFSFALIGRAQVLRPLTVFLLWGFAIYLLTMTGLTSQLLIMIWGTVMSISVQAAILADNGYLRNFSRRYLARSSYRPGKVKSLAIVALTLAGSGVVLLIEGLQRQDYLSAITGPKAEDPAFVDLQAVIEKHSGRGDQILILNGRETPAFPLYAICDRRPAGYFISSEPFGVLSNMKDVKFDEQRFGLPFGFQKAISEKLYARLSTDILASHPPLILIESGQTFDHISSTSFSNVILVDYKISGEARYRSRCSGAREFADWNYRYNILLIQ